MITTPRLTLRLWRDDDLASFAALNADPEVMKYLPKILDHSESDALINRIRLHFDEYGFGPWALEITGTGDFIGFTGLSIARFEAHFTPCVEIGWRLARAYWGQGYASEAARAGLAYGFDTLNLHEVVAFTTTGNRRSRAVMERIGLVRNPDDDFDHPALPEKHPQRRHVLYRSVRRNAAQQAA
jgi:RimJ/RimL family protein N-acetyltransferase